MFYKLLVLFTAFVPVVLVCSVLGEFPTEPVTSEAHPYPLRVFEQSKEEADGRGKELTPSDDGAFGNDLAEALSVVKESDRRRQTISNADEEPL
ncbi:hypothetical protein Taro_003902 [Colocasia esculenta]|uniref:Secreted protein n=1 Tax=Colocasia esculenta TaxID=4460 RepID=A0A843TQ62_COLES|nr:hypothetical protein [Colocasia esculenta]